MALTIAGSDSGGGAGIQADLKTFHRFRVFGTSVVTAVTAQNTRGVVQWSGVDATLVKAQIDALAADLRPRALKTGMLGEPSVVHAVACALRDHQLRPYVMDPVVIASSGDALSTPDTLDVMRRELLPLADIVTPNLGEAEALVGVPVRDVDGMHRAARLLVARHGAKAALITGGHLDVAESGNMVVDVWFDGTTAPYAFRHRRINGPAMHGTGCTLSAAITARLALGDGPRDAVRRAISYVGRAIRAALPLGGGARPLNHWA